MGLFDRFKKQDCEICGKEVGMFGYKKLEDGEICKDCVKLLSPWFEDRRHATVAQIKEQIAYRQQNAKELENFTISRQIGEEGYIMYVEEVDDIPTRFFVTDRSDYKAVNPDIISFKDVVSCVTDVDERHEEIKQRNSEGQMVSYRPPRYKHHHDFYIKMEIRNNPYFNEIKFRINGSDIVLETAGDVGGGIGGAVLAGVLQGVGISTVGAQANTPGNFSERRRYAECATICQKIGQAVEDGKRGAQYAAVIPAAPVQEAPKPKFCPNCGAPYEGGKFCQNCGNKL